MIDSRKGLKISEGWAAVILVALVAALAYLPLSNQLGFYRDDWHVLWAASVQGAQGVIDQHTLDRPLMGVIYAGVGTLLGENPVNWQLFAYLVRVAGGLVLLWLLRIVVPNQRRATLMMALLFIVYPGFYEQPNANTYQNHLLALIFGILSIGLSVRFLSTQTKVARIALGLGSVLAALVCYLMFEWMIGLEGLRLALLWHLSSRETNSAWRQRLKRLFPAWFPGLLAAGSYGFWRVFIFKSARSVTDVGNLVSHYRLDPAGSMLRVVIETAKSFFVTIFSAWLAPLYQFVASMSSTDFLLGLLTSAIGIGFFFTYLRLFKNDQQESPGVNSWLSIVGTGAFAVVSAVLPPVLAERGVEFHDGLERYTLTAMVSVAIIMVGLIYFFLRADHRPGFSAFLLGLGILTQFGSAVYFRDYWQYQQQLWWQLSWRAPDLKNDTALIPLLPFGYRLAEGYEVWAPANLIYRPGINAVQVSGEALNSQTALYLTEQLTLGRTMRKVEYKVDFKNSLVLSIPAKGSCLHVLDGQQPEYSIEDDPLIRLVGGYSRISMIETDKQVHQPPAEIFGHEPPHGWCYYYQKASLARQRKDWEEVTRLGDEALSKGLSPQDISEWIPFYQGYVHRWQYDKLGQIASVLRADHFFIVGYCQQFQDFKPDPTALDNAEEFMINNLCGQLEQAP